MEAAAPTTSLHIHSAAEADAIFHRSQGAVCGCRVPAGRGQLLGVRIVVLENGRAYAANWATDATLSCLARGAI